MTKNQRKNIQYAQTFIVHYAHFRPYFLCKMPKLSKILLYCIYNNGKL